jgi:hypothetical protein
VITSAGITASWRSAVCQRKPAMMKYGSAHTRYWSRKFGLNAKIVSQRSTMLSITDGR